MNPPSISRRAFLRASGVSLALPMLEAMTPTFARAAATAAPRRLLAIQTNMGILPQFFFPEKAGRDYAAPPYLELLRAHRADYTVFSGVSHPEVDGGHQAEACFLTAAPHPGRAGFRNQISLDQFAAQRLGPLTRFPSLPLCVGTSPRSLSFNGAGVELPPERSAATLFRKLFVQGSAEEVAAQLARLRTGRSILDSVGERAKSLAGRVGPADRAKLDQYFTSVRALEQRLVKNEDWEQRPKPKPATDTPPPDHDDPAALIEQTRSMFDLARLAFQSDSTRLVTLMIFQLDTRLAIDGVGEPTHPLTHHGNRPERIDQLRLIEEAQFRELAALLAALKGAHEEEAPLLDRTAVLYGTCMGNANAHSNTNLPVLLAGGGFRHGQHLAFDRERNAPLACLFVSLLQRLGIDADQFATGTGTMKGLELA